MKDGDIIALVNADYSVAEKARIGPNVKNRQHRKAYFQEEYVPGVAVKIAPKSATDGRSHMWIGITRAIVDTAMSMISGSIFSVDPPVKIEPTEEGDEESSVQFENLFQYRSSRHQMNLRHHFKNNWLFQACLYDYAIARIGWLVKSAYVPHATFMQKMVQLARFRRSRTIQKIEMIRKLDAIDRPDIEILDTLNTYPDPHALDFDDSRYFMYHSKTNRSAMKKRELTKKNPLGFYVNVDKIEPNSYTGLDADRKTESSDETQLQAESDMIQLLPYYIPDAMVMIANEKWVVHKQKMRGFPFSKMTYMQPNHQWGGVGLVEGIERLQLDINHLTRLRRDNLNLIVNAITIVNKALFPDEKDFELRPNRIFGMRFGDPTKAMHFPRPPDNTQVIVQEIAFQIKMAERISGIADPMQGTFTPGRKTATEVDLVMQGGATRISEIAKEIETKNMVDVVYMVYNEEQIHLTEEVKYRILGKYGYEYKKIRKGDIFHKGAFDVRPVGTSFEANRTVKTNQFLQAVGIVSQNPAFMQMTDSRELLQQIWSRLGEKDSKRFLLDGDKADYSIPPEMENVILESGSELQPNNRDSDEEHIPVHREHTESPEFINLPPEIQDNFEKHIGAHEERREAMQQVGKQGQTGLPTEPGNVLGQPFDQAMSGGLRTPAGGRPEGGGMPIESPTFKGG